MPGIDFNYSGLGEAYRVFAQKHARLLDVRRDLEHRRAGHIRQMESNLEAQRATQTDTEPGFHHWSGASDRIGVVDIYDQHRLSVAEDEAIGVALGRHPFPMVAQ